MSEETDFVTAVKQDLISFHSPLARDVHVFFKVASTNSEAKDLAYNGAQEGTIVISGMQDAGRGRFIDRRWMSPPGGIYMTLVLRPNNPAERLTLLPLIGALGVHRSIAEYIDLPLAIKWPNDVCIQGRKLAGVLLESSIDASGERYVLLGIGLNLNTQSEDLPSDRPVSSLSQEIGIDLSYIDSIKRLLEGIQRYYTLFKENDYTTILSEWRRCTDTLGRKVVVKNPKSSISGIAEDIDPQGFLIIHTDSGKRIVLSSGDCEYVIL